MVLSKQYDVLPEDGVTHWIGRRFVFSVDRASYNMAIIIQQDATEYIFISIINKQLHLRNFHIKHFKNT